MLLLRHRDTGNPKGAFVEFETAAEVGKAVERNGMVRFCYSVPAGVCTLMPFLGLASGVFHDRGS